MSDSEQNSPIGSESLQGQQQSSSSDSKATSSYRRPVAVWRTVYRTPFQEVPQRVIYLDPLTYHPSVTQGYDSCVYDYSSVAQEGDVLDDMANVPRQTPDVGFPEYAELDLSESFETLAASDAVAESYHAVTQHIKNDTRKLLEKLQGIIDSL